MYISILHSTSYTYTSYTMREAFKKITQKNREYNENGTGTALR